MSLQLNHSDLIAVDRELCKRSLSEFIKLAWHVIEPMQPYVHGWHIDAICEHLEAVHRGEINRLLINIPPGTMKSLCVSVFFPAWEWGPRGKASLRYVAASHSETFSVRDNMRMRRLVKSEWFQSLWPVELEKDQDAKLNFGNKSTGFRQAMAVRSMTGARGDRVIWDDPHSVEGSLSDKERETTVRIFEETLPTRVNNPDKSAIIIVMQRLHERDVSGVALEKELGYEHLCLPMEFDETKKCKTSIGFEDPRKEDGELLFPERFPREVVERDKKALGPIATAGQFQQRPTPRGGGMFPVEMFQIIDFMPVKKEIAASVRFWDKAGTEGAGAYTAGVLMHRLHDGRFVISHVVRGQWGALKREQRIKQTAQMDGFNVKVYIEQEPGSGGKESAEATIRNLSGFIVEADRVTGDKETRADPYASQVQGGNVFLLRAEWNKEFMDEHESFPAGKYKDQVDAAGGAFSKLNTAKLDYSVLTRM